MATNDMGALLHEGWAEYGEVRCIGCNDREVDLSNADTYEEAIETWNEHVRNEHPEMV